MDHYKLVLPEHINHYGHLFGGNLLNWIDEFAYITATVDFPGRRFVTVAMDNVEFRYGIDNGEVLLFRVEQQRLGRTSVTYKISVFGTVICPEPEKVLFSTNMTFVNVDSSDNKLSNDLLSLAR